MPTEREQEIMKARFSKGFELLDSFQAGEEARLEQAKATGDPEAVKAEEQFAQKTRIMRGALDRGEPKPLMQYLAMMVENGMRGIGRDLESGKKVDVRHLDNLKSVFEVLEQLAKG